MGTQLLEQGLAGQGIDALVEDIRDLDILSKQCLEAAEDAASKGEHRLVMEYDGLYLMTRGNLEALVEDLYREYGVE